MNTMESIKNSTDYIQKNFNVKSEIDKVHVNIRKIASQGAKGFTYHFDESVSNYDAGFIAQFFTFHGYTIVPGLTERNLNIFWA